MDITMVTVGLILLTVPIVGVIVQTIKTSITLEQWNMLLRLAEIGVYAAEQIYGRDLPQQKYKEVKEWLLSKNLKVNDEDIDRAIEAAVKKMKVELQK